MSQKVFDHFDAQAADYARRSAKWPWGWLRRREVRAILSLLDPQPGERILDAGCGAGHYAALIQNSGAEVVGIDASEKMVEAARARGIEAMSFDLQAIAPRGGLPGAPYDKVLCAGVLEFCELPCTVISNIFRGLRDEQSSLVMMMPRDCLWGRLYRRHHAKQGVRCRLFDREFLDLLSRMDVFVDQITTVGFNWVVKCSEDRARGHRERRESPGTKAGGLTAAAFDRSPIWLDQESMSGHGWSPPTGENDLDDWGLDYFAVRCRIDFANGESRMGVAKFYVFSERRDEISSVTDFDDAPTGGWRLSLHGRWDAGDRDETLRRVSEEGRAKLGLDPNTLFPLTVTIAERDRRLGRKRSMFTRDLRGRWEMNLVDGVVTQRRIEGA